MLDEDSLLVEDRVRLLAYCLGRRARSATRSEAVYTGRFSNLVDFTESDLDEPDRLFGRAGDGASRFSGTRVCGQPVRNQH